MSHLYKSQHIRCFSHRSVKSLSKMTSLDRGMKMKAQAKIYSRTCLKRPLKKRQNNLGLKDKF